MNHLAARVLLAVSVAAVVPVRAGLQSPGVGQSANATAESEVRRLSAEEVQAFLKNDPKTMARLWSDDFVVTNPLNQLVTKPQVLGMVEKGVLVITSFDRQIDYAKVYGDTVILAGRETVLWGGKMPNVGRTEQLRFTAVWMKQQDRWQQVARHANVVPER
jgi:ketosteroid isomerase-like protein